MNTCECGHSIDQHGVKGCLAYLDEKKSEGICPCTVKASDIAGEDLRCPQCGHSINNHDKVRINFRPGCDVMTDQRRCYCKMTVSEIISHAYETEEES